ncbi:MAG: hypothetical protein ABGY95_03045 [Rubritalea sp.]|uniref:hypothetical protein n=1 Tax=Rubritalea sp. TaxID=2109375 RepID=UPI0032427DC9
MSDSKLKLVGVTVALLLHLIVALALTHETITQFLFSKRVAEKKVEPKVPEPVVSFRFMAKPVPEPKKVPEPKSELSKMADKQRYNRTTDEQPQEKPKDAKFYGDSDTVAQSNAKVDPNAVNRPSVDGERTRDYPAMASSFQDGSIEHEAVGQPNKPSQNVPSVTPAPSTEPVVAENLQDPVKQPDVAQQMDAGKPLSGSSVPLADYLDAINKLPSEIRSSEPIADIPDKDNGKADTDSDKEEQLKEMAKAEQKPKPKVTKIPSSPVHRSNQPGFRPTTEASQMIGSISRRGGVSSLDTEATPLGKYKKAVHKSIAKEWYRRIGQNPDLIKPGALQVRWFVYDTGKVRGINILRELQGSEIQKGITIQSISTASIPKMPNSLKKQLSGDPVEITITFQF